MREQVGVRVGDLLQAQADNGKIVFTPKPIVDRALAEGLDDLKRGRVHGPFAGAAEMLAALKGKVGNPSGELSSTVDEVAPNPSADAQGCGSIDRGRYLIGSPLPLTPFRVARTQL